MELPKVWYISLSANCLLAHLIISFKKASFVFNSPVISEKPKSSNLGVE